MPSICFPNHRGLPGQPDPPEIDGYVEPEAFMPEADFGDAPGPTDARVDTGWTQSSRITYGSDASAGLGRPLMTYQGIKHRSDDLLYLAFVVRRDTAFDDNDAIVLVLHPSFAAGSAAKTGAERRIDIFPSAGGVGAGDPASTDPDDFSGTIGSQSVTIRANRVPRNTEYYRWDTVTDGWVSIAAPASVEIRVRSWDLGTNNRNWSVEVQIPTTVAKGGAGWIDLSSSFGFYFNVIRLCGGTECTFDPTPFDGGSFQFTWPRADYTSGERLITGVLSLSEAEIPPSWLGEAFLESNPGCSGVTGVRFAGGSSGSIGVLSGATLGSAISATAANTFAARVENTGSVAAPGVEATFRIANWGVGPGDANKWNLIPATGGTSNPTPPHDFAASVGPPVQADLTMEWTLSPPEQALYGGALSAHQCIWVLLDSNQSVDFVQSSIRRNMNIVGLSEHEQTAEISGIGHPEPADGSREQKFVLLVSQMLRLRLLLKRDEDQPDEPDRPDNPDNPDGPILGLTSDRAVFRTSQQAPSLDTLLQKLGLTLRSLLSRFKIFFEWLWITDAYRETGFSWEHGGKRYRIYEPTGSFGYIGEHEGLVLDRNQSVEPYPDHQDRFEQVGDGGYKVRAPVDGATRIVTRLEVVPFRIPPWIWLIPILLLLLIWWFAC